VTTNAARAEMLVRALRAGIDGDHETVRTLVTHDVRAWTPAFATATRDELIEALDHRDDAFSDIDLRATPLDVGGDFACVEWSVDMTHTGALSFAPLTSIEPTGMRVTVHGITVAEFDGDQICSFRQYWDELAVLEQLGLLGE
jgi:ketosteroid isomerase-like protein